MHELRILILHPDPAGRALLTSMLKSPGYAIEEATNDRMAVRLMGRDGIDLVLATVDPGDGDALELLTYVWRKHREVPVVLLFPRLDPRRAREALRLGAMAVLKYPVPAAELRAAVLQAFEQREPRPDRELVAADPEVSANGSATFPRLSANGTAHHEASADRGASLPRLSANGTAYRADLVAHELGLVGDDPSWCQVLELAGTLAATRASLLIVGEPGTGKSLVARLIHALGPGPQGPFVTIEAAEIAEKVGMPASSGRLTAGPTDSSLAAWSNVLDQARGGSLYLDEVAGLPIELQGHLLRGLQHRDPEASTGPAAPHDEIRFLIATCEHLPALIEQGWFRQELYHRLGVISLMLPPLRHRGTDNELLAETFRARYAHEFRKVVTGFSREALDALRRHDWPGNVRELEAAVRRGVALCSGPRITAGHLIPGLDGHRPERPGSTPRPHLPMGIRPLKEALEEPEKRIIIQALEALDWNRQETARVLGINRTTLYKKMKKYGLLIDEAMRGNRPDCCKNLL
jgi:two-component system response regulator HydG